MFVQAFDTKISKHSFGTHNTLKGVICLSVSLALLLLLCQFHKTHDLTDYQLTFGSFLPAITFM